MRTFWTQAQVDQLTELYPVTPMNQLQKIMGMKAHKIYNKAFALGLKKTEEYLNSPNACRFTGHLSEQSIKHQFKKGHVPFNKGVKGICYEGSKPTQFKKGSKPPNYRPVGTIRIVDGYQEIKIAEGMRQWRQLHRVIWERLNGPIPKGYNLVFLDGNKKNISIANLSLISKADNMKRNSVHNYPKEIVHLVQLKAALNRQINKRKKHEQPRT